MPKPRFDLADRLEHQAGNVENDGHINAARYMREAASVLRLAATSPGDAVRALQSIAALSVEKGHTIASAQQIANAALAPEEKVGDEVPYGTHVIDKLSAKKHNCRQLARYIWDRAHNTPMCFEQDIARLIENERRMAVERSKNVTPPAATPTPPSADVVRFKEAAIAICLEEAAEWDSDDQQELKNYAGQCANRISKLSLIQSAAHGGGTEGGEA